MSTEAVNPASRDLDSLPTEEVLRVINAEDSKVADAVARVIPQMAKLVDSIVSALRRGGRLVYMGAGTSGRIAVTDASEWVPTFGVDEGVVVALIAGGDVALRKSVEGAEDDEEAAVRDLSSVALSNRDVFLGLSASGRTPYVLAGARYAKGIGAMTSCVTSNPGSPLANEVDIPIVVQVGPEVVAGSTRMKAGTAQKLVLNSISTAVMVRMGRVYRGYMVEVRPLNSKLRERAVNIVAELCGVDREVARRALIAAEFDVKAAVVSLKLGVDPERAKSILESNDRDLRKALGEAR